MAIAALVLTASCTPNQPPDVQAGSDQVVYEGDSVKLHGTAYDPDGSIAAYRWEQLAGKSVSISGGDRVAASFAAPHTAVSDTLKFRLTVVDDADSSASDEVIVTVKEYGTIKVVLSGTVTNRETRAGIPGAVVTVAQRQGGTTRIVGYVATTLRGRYVLNVLTNPGRLTVNANAGGFATQSTVINVIESTGLCADLVMNPVGVAQSINPQMDAAIRVDGQTVVSLPAKSLVTASGQAASGTATAKVTVLDASRDRSVMPGTLERRNPETGAIEQIESYGAVNAEFEDVDGAPLNLARGQQATLSIPLASARQPADAPATIPLFYWSNATGYWVEDGEAVLEEVSPGRWAYTGSVGHFTTWNADVTFESITIKGCVTDGSGKPVRDAEVTARGRDYVGESTAFTNADGRFEIDVRLDSKIELVAAEGSLQSDASRMLTGSEDMDLDGCLAVTGDQGIRDFPMKVKGTTGSLEICVRDHECEDGDKIGVDVAGSTILSGEIVNDWNCRTIDVRGGKSYEIELTALNGTGYKGDCSHADANTGEIRVTGENTATQRWRHRGGAGSKAQIIVETMMQPPVITSHIDNERVTSRVVELRGTAASIGGDDVRVHFNDVEQIAAVVDDQFNTKVVLKSGRNSIKVCQGGENCSRIVINADIKRLGLMATLTWSGGGDLDLYVETPYGNRCYFDDKRVRGACELDIDDQNGNNPENISIPFDGEEGRYRFWVENYSNGQGNSGELVIYREGILYKSIPFTVNVSNRREVLTQYVNWP